MLNSVSTIFTMDIYTPYIKPEASQKQIIHTGRLTAIVALIIASAVAPLLAGQAQIFQYIQEYTGLVSPGILAIFLMGLFVKKTTAKAAVVGALGSIAIAAALKVPALGLPFLDQMFYTTVLTMVLIFGVSLTTNPDDDDPKAIRLTAETFRTTRGFAIGSYAVMVTLAVLYAVFW
jgi:SSS family solute:Na+ symporter